MTLKKKRLRIFFSTKKQINHYLLLYYFFNHFKTQVPILLLVITKRALRRFFSDCTASICSIGVHSWNLEHASGLRFFFLYQKKKRTFLHSKQPTGPFLVQNIQDEAKSRVEMKQDEDHLVC
jgi:hypothetical protein